MNKKVVIFGGGTGMSYLIRGLKQFPIDISAVVTVSDDGRSTGRLREEFNIPAVGDIRQVLVSLSETEPLFEKLLNYRFSTNSDLNGHPVGNLLLTAMKNITGSIQEGIESLGKVLNLKGSIFPVSEDNVVLMGKMEDDSIIEGEHNITDSNKKIKEVFYKEKPLVNSKVIGEILTADLIVLSMGSLYTSIIPTILCDKITDAIDKSKANIVYTCNLMTQPGETDKFKLSDHIRTLNKYLKKKKIDTVIANNGLINKNIAKKYSTLEQKDPVLIDIKETNKFKVKVIRDNLITIENNILRHDTLKLGFHIFSLLMRQK